MNTFQRKNHKKEKIITICVMLLCIIIIGILSYFLYIDIKSRPLIEYPKYTLSTTDWTSSNVVITILDDNQKISAYSFDGGKNYQNTNTYEAIDNGEFYIVVKDINGRTSKMIPISITRIDKEGPIINFENNTTIQVGSNFSLRNGVAVYDNGSGLNSNYITVPEKIDTNNPGEYIVKYTAFDKAGNFTEKERKIVVTDIKGTTYYRYRDAKIETYQCEEYACNCVVTETAKLNQSCPSGYHFNEPDKCCQTCYKTCKKTTWGEWSEWSEKKVEPTSMREVETKVE